MELIYISETQLKIILSGEDLMSYGITADQLDYSNVSTRHLIWAILNSAKSESGFNADNSKLSITVFDSADGGCELYIKKESIGKTDNISVSQYKAKTYRHSALGKAKGKYIVADLSSLCKLSYRIISDKFHLRTSLYFDSRGNYILTVNPEKRLPSYITDKEKHTNLPQYLSEYGASYELTEKALTHINEYCKMISEGNAAELLSTL